MIRGHLTRMSQRPDSPPGPAAPPSPPSPSEPRRRFGLRYSLLARRWRRALERRLAAAGLTDATWLPLVHLHEGGDGVAQGALAARMELDASSRVRLLDILERQGLVARRPDPADRRARLIALTEAGRARVAEILAELQAVEAVLLQDIPDAELTRMLEHLAKIEARLSSPEAQAMIKGAGPEERT